MNEPKLCKDCSFFRYIPKNEALPLSDWWCFRDMRLVKALPEERGIDLVFGSCGPEAKYWEAKE